MAGYRAAVLIVCIIGVSGNHSIGSIIHSQSVVRLMVASVPVSTKQCLEIFFFQL